MSGMQAEHRQGRAATRRDGAGEAGGAAGHGRARRGHGGRGGEGAASRHSPSRARRGPGGAARLSTAPGCMSCLQGHGP